MFTNPGILIKFTGYNKIILTNLRWILNNLSNPEFQIWKHSSKCLATVALVESSENRVHSLSESRTRNQIIRKLGYSWLENNVISLSRPLAFQLAMSRSRNIIAKWQKRLGHIGKSLAFLKQVNGNPSLTILLIRLRLPEYICINMYLKSLPLKP